MALDIGPFADQSDLLHFAMLLETIPGIGHIDLIDVHMHTSLFVVRALSPAALRAAVLRVPDYRITALVTGNAVSARITRHTRAVELLARPGAVLAAPGTTSTYHNSGPNWWRRASIAVAASGVAAALGFLAFTYRPETPTIVAVRPASVATATSAPIIAPGIPTIPAFTASPSATAAASPSAKPTATPSTTPTVAPLLTQHYRGSFSSAFGSISALNGCEWDTPFTADLDITLTRSSNGNMNGQAAMTGTISYVVTNTPTGASCNGTTATIDSSGSATGSSSQASASLAGARDLVVTFSGSNQGASLTGTVSVQRSINTTSSFGDTSETRSASVSGVTLTRSS